jgi:hypothetical protein
MKLRLCPWLNRPGAIGGVPYRYGIGERDGRFFFMPIESDVEFGHRVKGGFRYLPCSDCG